ncbi:putative MYND finger [Lyophyllum shimeji]|uniref:MYND finger n=1 Tax=Lyophyllum shimeji TaxID=47721 RepID=A0A9P3PSJ6_LYOSH|nr:putative MYND finger [Lyophyllum shimeji]
MTSTLDTTSPLPLLNSLTHLTYLTSTSPRIREIMTMDGGLERLVRILHDFCLCPRPRERCPHVRAHPALRAPAETAPDAQPADMGQAGRVPLLPRLPAGTLEVVGCILEAWLANKGFAVGPSSSATGMPRETRAAPGAEGGADGAAHEGAGR